MVSKSQSQIYLEELSGAEQKVLDANADIEAKREASKALREETGIDLDKARKALGKLREGLASGDYKISAEMLSLAAAEVERLEILHQGHEARVKAARGTPANKDVADKVREITDEYFSGKVPVGSTFVATPQRPAKPAAYPVAVVSQTEKVRFDLSGRMMSGVRLRYFKDSLMAPIDAERFERIAYTRNAKLEVLTQQTNTEDHGDGLTCDIIRVSYVGDPVTPPPLDYTPRGDIGALLQRESAPTFAVRLQDHLNAVSAGGIKWLIAGSSGEVITSSVTDGRTWNGTVSYQVLLEKTGVDKALETFQGVQSFKLKYKNQSRTTDAEDQVIKALSTADIIGNLLPGVGLVCDARGLKVETSYQQLTADAWGRLGRDKEVRDGTFTVIDVVLDVACKPKDLEPLEVTYADPDELPLPTLRQYAKSEGLPW